MLKLLSAACLVATLALAVPAALASTPKGEPGTIVILFKDGHRQSYKLADIERVEFPGGDVAASGGEGPSRSRFVGRWDVGDGMGGNFTITLSESGDAARTLGDVRGKWMYVDGEAQIKWDDGAGDAIRRVGSKYQKFAYKAGKAFSDVPDNVTGARNMAAKPI
jgi:hypothetical protein